MKKLFVLGTALLALIGSACATRGYARRQAREVNDRLTEVQAQAKGYSDKHDTDLARIDERITTTDNKLQAAAASSARADASAAQANANAARADASAAQANASAARSEAAAAQAKADAALADAAQQRALLAQNTAPPAQPEPELPPALPATGSPLPVVGLSGLLSFGVAGALRLLRR